jgi:hypothetical protein
MLDDWRLDLASVFKKLDNRVFHRKTNHQLTFGVLADPLYIGSDSAGTTIRKSKILYGVHWGPFYA